MFRQAIENTRDISESFWAHFGTDRYLQMVQSDEVVVKRIRKAMGSIRSIIESATEVEEAEELLKSGKVAAVDGTNAVEPVELLTTTYVVVATAWMTRVSKGDPSIQITDTSLDWTAGNPEDIDLDALLEQLDEFRSERSWPVTLREYKERELAADLSHPVVLLDGPIATQNLVTQRDGRELLARLLSQDKVVIGVIKNVSASWQRCRWFARALHTGEWHLVEPLTDRLVERYGDQKDVIRWTKDTLGDELCRYVYRPANKPFAFECKKSDLPLALSILHQDSSGAINHEIPDLLNQVDNCLRSTFYESGLLAQYSISQLCKEDMEAGIFSSDERWFR